jgi:DNA-directed RNA polymerase subunit alpha
MAILAFQKPDKVLMLEADNFYGKFEFRPLEPGYGITIGNALRRILLSSLEGFAFSTIKIEGINHEFASIPGVMEDVQNIILNLKQVRFKRISNEIESAKVSVPVSGTKVFKAGDIGKHLAEFEILNPSFEICHLDAKASFKMELTITKGRGYVPAEENVDLARILESEKKADSEKTNEPEKTDVRVIAMDSIYTPIRNVKYSVENFRVEQKTDYEKLILEIKTDGSIHPKEALKEAAKILIYHFMLFSDDKIAVEAADTESNEEFDEDVLHMRQLLKSKLIEMNLSVRALNCLKTADVETVGELVAFNKNDLLKFRNFGKKSLTELEDLLVNLNLSFGMDISKYKLDKE